MHNRDPLLIEQKKRGMFTKILLILLLFNIFVLSFPCKMNEGGHFRYSSIDRKVERIGLTKFLALLRGDGYTVFNQFPTYIQVEKKKVNESASYLANKISMEAWLATGQPVKIILVTQDGRYVGYYKPE